MANLIDDDLPVNSSLKDEVAKANRAVQSDAEIPGSTPEVVAINELKKAKALSPWLIAVISVPVLFYFNSLRTEISDLRSQLAEKTELLNRTTDNYNAISAAIDRQNDAIMKANRLAERSVQEAKALNDDLLARRKASEDAVRSILTGKKPRTCEDARQFLIDGVKDLQW
jgi:hypothetical protein